MNYRTKVTLIVTLTILATILAGVLVAQAATVPWPSISPSYRCDGDAAIYTLVNVGTDMVSGSQWYVAAAGRIVRQGVFWIAAGQTSTWAYSAPGIELTFAYVRPDNGQWVRMAQTCGVKPTPEPTPTVEGQDEHRWFFPWVMP